MKKILFVLAAAAIIISLVLMFNLYSKGRKVLVIKGGILFDGTDGPPLKDVLIIIEGQKIKSISNSIDAKPPLFARTILAENEFIVPGLIDMHVHFTEESFCEHFLRYGVTTVRDVGNITDFIVSLRDRIEKGEKQGPTIFTSGYLINNRKIPYGASRQTAVVRTPRQARRVVALLAGKKVDLIKVYMSLPPRLLRIVLQEAKKYNLPVAGHLRRVDARRAAKWGISTLEHATGISEALLKDRNFEDVHPDWTISNKTWLHADRAKYDELIDLLVKKNVYITANLTLYASMCSTPEELQDKIAENMVPEKLFRDWKSYLNSRFLKLTEDRKDWIKTKEKLEEFLILFKEKGGKVLAGTDTPWPFLFPGLSLHEELHLLVKAGFTPEQALLTATRYPAEALNRADSLGTIEKGKTANLVILGGNPLKDIRQTQNIITVIKEGKVINRLNH